jgi:predicted transcriptional regulator of viral defense system
MRQDPDLPKARARLAAVLRATHEVISVDAVVAALGVDRSAAAKQLSRWLDQGWLRRVGRGLYVPVPLELAGNEQVVEDPWTLIPALFDPCYVAGWTAAHHWDLTEQLFTDTVVFTTRRVSSKRYVAQGVTFLLHHVAHRRLFGLKSIWRGTVRVQVSDAARTLVDMLALPESGGGIDHVADCLGAYRRSQTYDREVLLRYGDTFGNGAVFKRLGFLAEAHLGDDELARECATRLTKGLSKLDPSLRCDRLQTGWHLWVPQRWKDGAG